MPLRRRRFLALASAGAMPALAGCTPCGETWTGVGFEVDPLAVDRDGGWRVDAKLTVDFDFGREGYGLEAAALALFDADGAVLDEAPTADLTWSDVPEERRETTDCGDHATVTRTATLESEAFPRWIGVRYDRFSTSYDDPTLVARHPSATPGESVTPSAYEPVDATDVSDFGVDVDPEPPVAAARFDAGPLRCDGRSLGAEARTNVLLTLNGSRVVPTENYHPVLEGVSLEDDELTVAIGLRTAPRFRRGDCRRTWWTASVDLEGPDDVPATVAVRYLDRTGDVTGGRRVDVEPTAPVPAATGRTPPARRRSTASRSAPSSSSTTSRRPPPKATSTRSRGAPTKPGGSSPRPAE